jgi:hypothetical protein
MRIVAATRPALGSSRPNSGSRRHASRSGAMSVFLATESSGLARVFRGGLNTRPNFRTVRLLLNLRLAQASSTHPFSEL